MCTEPSGWPWYWLKDQKKKKKPHHPDFMFSSTGFPTADSGLAKSSKHSTTEWAYTLWSHSTPISLCYKLGLHTVSVHHLLVQRCLLKMKMTGHGGGRGGWLVRSGACLTGCAWLESRDTVCTPILKVEPLHFSFIPFCQSYVRRLWGRERVYVTVLRACFTERKRKGWSVFAGLCK